MNGIKFYVLKICLSNLHMQSESPKNFYDHTISNCEDIDECILTHMGQDWAVSIFQGIFFNLKNYE